LAIDALEGNYTPATLVILGLATAELRTAPPLLVLDASRPRAVHGLLHQAEALRGQFAGVGAKTDALPGG
jgi:hypothetical protein